jgi:hypothetical protein
MLSGPSLASTAIAPYDQHSEQTIWRAPNESELLAYDGKNEVVVLLGEIKVFLTLCPTPNQQPPEPME